MSEPADREGVVTRERLVIVIEYEAGSDPEQALREAMGQINAGTARLDPDHVKVMSVHVGIRKYVDRVLAVFAKEDVS